MEATILNLLDDRKFSELKTLITGLNPADIVEYFDVIPKHQLILMFRILPKELAAEVFAYLDSESQEHLINVFTDEELREVLDELFVDDTVDIIEEMPASVAKRVLKQTDAQTRKIINQLLAYSEDSAGSIMTTEYVDLKKNMSVGEAFKRIREIGLDKETIYTCYVTDRSRKLLGVVTAKDLLLSEYDALIEDIMDTNVISAFTTDDRETVAMMFDKYDFLTIPIVDTENRLIGIVTVDDAIDVLQEEATEDIEKMAAILPSDKPYLKTGIFEIFRSRILWLLILMFSATFTGMIITSFENALASCVILTAFMPMLMNTGGNSGSQASVTIIRALSLGEVDFKDTFKVILKELSVSLLCGTVLAVLNFLKMLAFDYYILGTTGLTLEIIFIVSLTLLATVIIAKLIGCSLPIVANRLGFDPAVMASPFITTIVDAISLIIYFCLANAMLNI